MAKLIALNHHERRDGTVYPCNLVGESTPVKGRITAIADVFDALITVFMQKIPDIVEVKDMLAD